MTRCLLIVAFSVALTAPGGGLAEDELFGLDNIQRPDQTQRYRQSWALIIGINYEGRTFSDPRDTLALPQLGNAEADAEAIYQLLVDHYGYSEEEGKNKIVKLIGPDATDDAINREIGKLRDPQRVQEDDSVLLFFAGHGVQLKGELRDGAAIFPYDVQLSGGSPIDNYLRMHSDLIGKLRSSNAKHKLVILDSCYSGEILKAGFHSPAERDDRSSLDRFKMPVFQAIASSRAYQVASDGGSVNSPFTGALRKALAYLPARDAFPNGIWTSRLFAYLHPEMKAQTDGQEPQLGILEGDGEFRFFPEGDQDTVAFFKGNRPKLDEQQLLQATVTSTEGDWWFHEIPWFIPGLRKQILDELGPNRSAASALIGRDQLRRITKNIVAAGTVAAAKTAADPAADDATISDRSGGAAELTPAEIAKRSAERFATRCQHAKLLLEVEGTQAYKGALQTIADDLQTRAESDLLEPVDFHFLAVAQSALNDDEQADANFQRAIKTYSHGKADLGDLEKVDKAMLALCLADYGQHLSSTRQAADAAQRFREADRAFGNEAPAAFRIFVLCREADAWLKLNRWADADEQLLQARFVAEDFDSGHQLSAYVYRRLAWARMIQWKIEDAEHWFVKSNEVLSNIFAGTGRTLANKPPRVDAESDGTPAADQPPTLRPLPAHGPFRIDEMFHRWDSYDAKIAFLHNLHGLAMVQRFKGRTAYAAEKYRWLAGEVANTLARLRVSTNAESDAEAKLYGRLVNTLERLADCNLFGDPRQRDLNEAVDDYRRALGYCHLSSRGRTTGPRAQLLYKQALALALPSNIQNCESQDTELALAVCRAADDIFSEIYATEEADGPTEPKGKPKTNGKPKANGMILALGQLTTKIVTLIDVAKKERSSDDQAFSLAVTDLREAIHQFREENGPNFHRDQLEICLVASRVLLEHGCEKDRFHLNEDAALLLSFCRLALAPHQSDLQSGTVANPHGQTRAYLRPFYDTAMASKLRVSNGTPRHVKDLLEIQREATLGRAYMKPADVHPTLAIYALHDDCYLLCDLPRGPSKCYSLSDDYDLGEIRKAVVSGSGASVLELPREVDRALAQWRLAHAANIERVPVDCRWEDPVLITPTVPSPLNQQNPWARVAAKPVFGRFPFVLPAGFVEAGELLADEAEVGRDAPGLEE